MTPRAFPFSHAREGEGLWELDVRCNDCAMAFTMRMPLSPSPVVVAARRPGARTPDWHR
jgi:hypothetical protein